MKGRILWGSVLVVFLLLFVPATNAIEIHTVEKNSITPSFSYTQIRSMDSAALILFIRNLANDYPSLSAVFEQKIQETEKTPVGSTATQQPGTITHGSPLAGQLTSDNQTLLEKIYWKVFNYRVFRLYISALIFVYHESPLTLMRTMTWGIKLLRLVKIGIILGYIHPTPPQPQQPTIVFNQDLINRTLTVLSVTPATIFWSDIDQIGAGNCDPFPNGNVTVGDVITNCTGIIVLRYIPLNEVLGVFEFD
jgi:hypothetical protein